MGLKNSGFKRHLFAFLNYAQILLSLFFAVLFPGWIIDGYLLDCYFSIGDFCFYLWIPVGIAVFGSLIGGILYTVKKQKRTGRWW